MITPIKAMTISQIIARQDDLLVSADDVKAIAKNERAKLLEEMKPFFDEVSEYVLDWICDELCGEFINPQTDESWCAEHCHNGTDYECIKKWCELRHTK